MSAIPFSSVALPLEVHIDRDFLVWDHSFDDRERRVTDATLLAFAQLHKHPERIPSFALKNGVFRAVQVKADDRRHTDQVLSDGSIWRLDATPLGTREPLALWIDLSKQMYSLLRINAALKGRAHNATPAQGSKEDWREIVHGARPESLTVEGAQFGLAFNVNKWLVTGKVGLALGLVQYSREQTDWRLDITYPGLIGALAYRLLLMVAGENSLYACSGCGTPYIRIGRAPKSGEENFCPDCKDVAKARALKRYREKNR